MALVRRGPCIEAGRQWKIRELFYYNYKNPTGAPMARGSDPNFVLMESDIMASYADSFP